MSTSALPEPVVYPESDGKPMADNTLQWDWMVKVVGELRSQFAGQEVFVAGDLFWYPVQGDPREVTAPDAMVVFGRPPGYRGSYRQWDEDGVGPQVVFEVLSPSNTDDEMDEKLGFYARHGVEEYYVIDPYEHRVEGYRRRGPRLSRVLRMGGFVSPRLGIRFEMAPDELVIYGPDGRRFQTREDREADILEELHKTEMAFEDERARAIREQRRADEEERRANREQKQAALERERATLLAAKLRELGVDPESVQPNG